MMDVLLHYREQMRYVLHEFVIMPDHLHLLLTPGADISLERALQLIKGGFSYGSVRQRQASYGRRASQTIGFATSMTTNGTPGTFT